MLPTELSWLGSRWIDFNIDYQFFLSKLVPPAADVQGPGHRDEQGDAGREELGEASPTRFCGSTFKAKRRRFQKSGKLSLVFKAMRYLLVAKRF